MGPTTPLHPELQALLEFANASPKLHELGTAAARAAYDSASTALDHPEPSGLELLAATDLTLWPGLPARLYRPRTAGSATPVLLYFHGGGYVLGGLDSHDALCRGIAWRAGWALLAIDYRRAPEHRFPAAFEDALGAYRWLLDAGASEGLDSARIAVGGDSVGGTLATAVCIAARDAGWPAPQLQALLYPCTGSRQDEASHRRLARGHLLEAETLQWMFSQTLRSDADREDWRFAPLRTPDLSGLPPAFIALAAWDPLLDEGRAYADRLAASSVAVEVALFADMVHDFGRLGGIVPEAAGALRARLARALTSLATN